MIKAAYDIIVRDGIPLDVEQNTILNIATNCVTASTHGFHKYPAKFIPHIPRWAIEKYLGNHKGKCVLDPFCGSGTTLVEGLLCGHNVIGIDIDPLSVLITKVKTTPIAPTRLDEIYLWLAKEINVRGRQGIFKPASSNLSHWFTKDAINKLSLIRTLIDEIPSRFGNSDQNSDITDLFLVCLSSIIRRVSNADNESQKTYVSHTKLKEPEGSISLFTEQLDLFKERITDFSKTVNPELTREVIRASSVENLHEKIKGKDVDLVVTSPPYIKAIDYIYNQMVELFWVGDLFGLDTQTKQNAMKEHYIGTKQLSKGAYEEYTPFKETLGLTKLDDKLREIYTKDKRNGHKHAFITYKYFSDMERHFVEIAKWLKPNTHYIMVVGDSSVSDVFLETNAFLASIAERNGFKTVNKWGYVIKNRYMRFDRKGRGGVITIDWVLDIVKT